MSVSYKTKFLPKKNPISMFFLMNMGIFFVRGLDIPQ